MVAAISFTWAPFPSYTFFLLLNIPEFCINLFVKQLYKETFIKLFP